MSWGLGRSQAATKTSTVSVDEVSYKPSMVDMADASPTDPTQRTRRRVRHELTYAEVKEAVQEVLDGERARYRYKDQKPHSESTTGHPEPTTWT